MTMLRDWLLDYAPAILIGLIVIFVLLLGVVYPVAYVSSADWTDPVTVTEKDRGYTKGGGSNYRVYTTDEVFENNDTLMFGKWNSADIQGRIHPGRTYRFRVAGWRWPFMSMFRNIIEVQEVQPSN